MKSDRYFARRRVSFFVIAVALIVIFSVVIKIPSVPKTYHVVGKQIIDNQGNIFIPYGVQLDGILMAQYNWATDSALTYLTRSQIVEADEWSQYQDRYSSRTGCMTDAPGVVPQFLTYLRSKNIGLIGYALFPGTLIRGWNFTNPTTFDRNPETCPVVSSHDYSPTAQGAGQLLEEYFAENSKQ